MPDIQIITDSMTDLPQELKQAYNVKVMPLTVFFDQEPYLDGVDLSPEEFYVKLEKSDALPRTSQVPPAAFQKAFEEALQEGKQVLCINASSKASGTYQSALIAKNEIESDQIRVVDTLGLSMGAGLTVIETARLIQQGSDLREAAEFAEKYARDVRHLFTVDTVTYLQKGGRITPGKALAATILNIKPILTVRDGLVDPLDRVRGSKKVIEKMLDLAAAHDGQIRGNTIAIAHGNDPERARILKNKLEDAYQPGEIIMADIGCTIGTHTGPGTLALFYHQSTGETRQE